jgi:cytochrome P450
MPGVKGTLRNVFGHATGGSFFDVAADRFEKYGPIYREEILGTRIVNIVDLEAAKVVLEAGIHFQQRPGMDAMDDVGDDVHSDAAFAALSNDYEKWYKFKSLVTPKLMRPKTTHEILPLLNAVADDFVARIEQLLMHREPIDVYKEELSHWTVEAMAVCLFHQCLGFYKHPPDSEAVDFVQSSIGIVSDAGKLVRSSPLYKYVKVPAYYAMKRKFLENVSTGMNIINKNLEQRKEHSGKETFFEYLSDNENVSSDTMAMYLSALMTAGIDTTSTTSIWILYELARNPTMQEKLYEELVSVLGPDGEVTRANIQRLPYINAIVKESGRMYPVAAYVVARIFDKDLTLLGYNVPCGVHIFVHQYLLSVDERYYGKDAKEFVPERWLRDETGRTNDLNAFTSVPFGHGVRMCLGRRLAKAMIHTLISKIVLNYRLEYAGKSPVSKIYSGGLMKPDAPVLLKFIPRKNGQEGRQSYAN